MGSANLKQYSGGQLNQTYLKSYREENAEDLANQYQLIWFLSEMLDDKQQDNLADSKSKNAKKIAEKKIDQLPKIFECSSQKMEMSFIEKKKFNQTTESIFSQINGRIANNPSQTNCLGSNIFSGGKQFINYPISKKVAVPNSNIQNASTKSLKNAKPFVKEVLKLESENGKDQGQITFKFNLPKKHIFRGDQDNPMWNLSNAPADSQILCQKQKPIFPQNAALKAPLLNNVKEILVFPVKGLLNGQFFCYLNSTIQCLFSVPEFNAYFYYQVYNQKGNYYDNSPSQISKKIKKFVPIISNLTQLYFNSQSEVVDLISLKKAISNRFPPKGKHDAQEFLRYILGEIQDELNPIIRQIESSDIKTAEEAYKQFLKTQTSIVDRLFAGQQVNTITCWNCKDRSSTFDPFFDLSLRVIAGIKHQTIYDSLNQFFQDEAISDNYHCDKCRSFSSVKKQTYISKTPKILTIHIQRFQGYAKKRQFSEFLQFPLDNLSIQQYSRGTNCGGASYNLIAMISYSNNQDVHYQAYVRRDSKWLICDDSMSYEVSEQQVMKQEAFLLFYKRMDERKYPKKKEISSDL